MRKLALVLSIIFILIGFSGCGKKSDSGVASLNKEGYNQQTGEQKSKDVGTSPNVAVVPTSDQTIPDLQNHKIIVTGQITIETLKFEESIENLKKYVNGIGGYIQNSNVSGYGYNYEKRPVNRNAEFVFRIPKNKYQEAFDSVERFGKIRSEQTSGEDITDSYFDTEARVKMLKIQEERILELLRKAGKLQDILELEKELMNIRYEIESLTGTLRKWDNLVEYSTLTVYVNEVDEVTVSVPKKTEGLFTTLLYTLNSSLKDLWTIVKGVLIIVVYLVPFLVPIAGILLIVLKLLKKPKGKYNGEEKKEEPSEEDKL